MNNENTYNIKSVCNITGLTEHTIRAWEKRYSTVTPLRTESNRRLYTEADLEKLILLAKAVKAGHQIGNISNLNIERLKSLQVGENGSDKEQPKEDKLSSHFEKDIDDCISSILKFNRLEFEKVLIKTTIKFSKTKILVEFIIPLLEKVGLLWERGDFRIIHEHFAVSVLRTFLGGMIESVPVDANSPKIITATLEGFNHELGALIAALYSMDFGWDAVFLGACLPAEEIVAAINENGASAVLLSLVYPNDLPQAGNQIRKIRSLLDSNFPIIITGMAASGYEKFIKETNSIHAEKLTSLQEILQRIRKIS